MAYRKKLIEVALPLEAINKASAHEKQPGIGAHPRGLHLWWARRPLAAARAIIFSQMVDDPSEYVEELLSNPNNRRVVEKIFKTKVKNWQELNTIYEKALASGMTGSSNPKPGSSPTMEEIAAEVERDRLFQIIEDLVLWENSKNEEVLKQARDEINRSWRRTCADNANNPRAVELFDPLKLPAFHDPFSGGGALPLEAQRLGMESYASDLNPVAVLINKAMIEIPSYFSDKPPVHPNNKNQKMLIDRDWHGAQGLAEDIRYYGDWMYSEAEKRIGYLFPKYEVSAELVKDRSDLRQYLGQKLDVIAWIWCRTVSSPNPAFSGIHVPLASTFMLSTKPGKEAYLEPIIEGSNYRFCVRKGVPAKQTSFKNGTKLARANFTCLLSGVPISSEYIKNEGKKARMGVKLIAVVAEGNRERVYLPASQIMESIANSAKPEWVPDLQISGTSQYMGVLLYGLDTFSKLFTNRQLAALTTLSDLVKEVQIRVKQDAIAAGMNETNDIALSSGGKGPSSYAQAISLFLSFAISRMADYNSSISIWKSSGEQVMHTYTRQAIAMTWDFAESNVFGKSAICWKNAVKYTADNLLATVSDTIPQKGFAIQLDASEQTISKDKVISTDPPYYDNVPYADLSDYFYIWLRHSLKMIFPDLLGTLAVPKAEELVAFSYRHNGKEGAEEFFLNGMTKALKCLADQGHPGFPVTIYYAFKQSESNDEGVASTGWETFLEAVIKAGFNTTGTWPIRTELSNRMRSMDSNALASSIVLSCRKRNDNAPIATLREFITALKGELPIALIRLQAGNIAPVDLAQAAIGPGMAIFTRFSKVVDANGNAISVRHALALINQTLDEVLAEQEGDFDSDTRFALAWFDQSGFLEGEYGVADVLARAKDTSVSGMVSAGIISSGRGKVRLLKPNELSENWDPKKDQRLTTWEIVHQLIQSLERNGESKASELMAKLGVKVESARELCYRLFTISERKKRTAEALAYNNLVQSWPEISRMAREHGKLEDSQRELF